jgi:GNAT superfamily N-acetyltransferase
VSLEIVAVDAADAEQLAAYHATYHAAHTHGREYATAFALEEVRAQLLTEGTGELNLAWSGLAGGEVVTGGSLWAPLDDNTHMATVEVGTRPADRRRGYGSAMLEHLVGEVRRLGRRTVLAEVSAPYDGPADGRGHPNVDFVLRRGFEFALGSVMRVLDLPADEGRLKRLAAEAEPHHRGYEFLQFRGAVPEDIIEQYGELTGAVAVEAPTGDLELERERFGRERIRAGERELEAAGRVRYATVALTPDGTPVAFSDVVVPAHDPGKIYQWGTLVRRDHRGHRLGVATKVRNLLQVQRECRDRSLLVTYNAEDNRHVIAVNEAMGFRPVERLGEYQRRLA